MTDTSDVHPAIRTNDALQALAEGFLPSHVLGPEYHPPALTGMRAAPQVALKWLTHWPDPGRYLPCLSPKAMIVVIWQWSAVADRDWPPPSSLAIAFVTARVS